MKSGWKITKTVQYMLMSWEAVEFDWQFKITLILTHPILKFIIETVPGNRTLYSETPRNGKNAKSMEIFSKTSFKYTREIYQFEISESITIEYFKTRAVWS